MKKASIYVFLTVVFFVNFSLVLASEERVLEINQKGEVRFVELYKEWKKATKEERLAWESPGREIPAGPKTINQTKRVDFFHFVEKSNFSKVVIFEEGRIETINKATEKVGKKQLAVHIILMVSAIFLMIVANILYAKDSSLAASSFAATATAFAAFAATAAFFAAFVVAAFAFVATAIIAAATIIAAADFNKRTYKFFVIIFYVVAVVSLFI